MEAINDEVLRQAIAKWGFQAQELMAVEECSELIEALLHHRRGKCYSWDVIDEIADVIIMAAELRIMYGEDAVDNCVRKKMSSLHLKLTYG